MEHNVFLDPLNCGWFFVFFFLDKQPKRYFTSFRTRLGNVVNGKKGTSGSDDDSVAENIFDFFDFEKIEFFSFGGDLIELDDVFDVDTSSGGLVLMNDGEFVAFEVPRDVTDDFLDLNGADFDRIIMS